MKTAGYSLAHAMLQTLHLSSVSKKAMNSHNRSKRGRQNFDVFTKLSEPSFQAVWLF